MRAAEYSSLSRRSVAHDDLVKSWTHKGEVRVGDRVHGLTGTTATGGTNKSASQIMIKPGAKLDAESEDFHCKICGVATKEGCSGPREARSRESDSAGETSKEYNTARLGSGTKIARNPWCTDVSI